MTGRKSVSQMSPEELRRAESGSVPDDAGFPDVDEDGVPFGQVEGGLDTGAGQAMEDDRLEGQGDWSPTKNAITHIDSTVVLITPSQPVSPANVAYNGRDEQSFMRSLMDATDEAVWMEAKTPFLAARKSVEYVMIVNGFIDFHVVADASGGGAVAFAPQWWTLVGKDASTPGLRRMGFKKVRVNSVPVSVHEFINLVRSGGYSPTVLY